MSEGGSKGRIWKWVASLMAILAVSFITLNAYDPESKSYDYIRSLHPESETTESTVQEGIVPGADTINSTERMVAKYTARRFIFKSASAAKRNEIWKALSAHNINVDEKDFGFHITEDGTTILYDTEKDELLFITTREANWIDAKWYRFKKAIGLGGNESTTLR